jgi:O-acetylhomoserine/O-acetylserine sulfhydrylase-like pyridoxal-dependent enzyme
VFFETLSNPTLEVIDIRGVAEIAHAAGALVVADNADHSPDYLARVRAPSRGYLSVPFADDVELSMRLG